VAARAAIRARIAAEGAESYLAETVAGSDSSVRRWAVRGARSLTVAIVRADVPGFQGEFVDAVGWAMAEWNQVALPVRFEANADSAHADVVVSWADTIDAERAGRADVTWNGAGAIVRVRILLATHLTGGRPITTRQMTTMALHELGHAVGLGHSPDPRDALYPTSGASALTPRDRRTATVLYALPTGSVRN
jgi:predicted Zn-dependent protease